MIMVIISVMFAILMFMKMMMFLVLIRYIVGDGDDNLIGCTDDTMTDILHD